MKIARTTARPAYPSARSERNANATPSGTAVSASPTLWIRSASRATLPVRTKITACAAAVRPRTTRESATAFRPARERRIERSTRPCECPWSCECGSAWTCVQPWDVLIARHRSARTSTERAGGGAPPSASGCARGVRVDAGLKVAADTSAAKAMRSRLNHGPGRSRTSARRFDVRARVQTGRDTPRRFRVSEPFLACRCGFVISAHLGGSGGPGVAPCYVGGFPASDLPQPDVLDDLTSSSRR